MMKKTSQSKSLLLIIIIINLCVMFFVVVLAKSDHDHHHHHHHDDHQHGHKLNKAKKIYNGRRATNQEARFMAAMLRPKGGGLTANERILCSAVIITHDMLLTAAHCFNNFSLPEIRRIEILPGATNIDSGYHGTQRDLIRTIKAFWIPPEFEKVYHTYDIAIIKVGPTPWVLGNRVTVAQMPIRIKSQGPPIKAYGYGREFSDILTGNLNVLEYTRIYSQAQCELLFGIRFKEPDISFATTKDRRSTYHQRLRTSSGPAWGDSGGGVFVKGVVERFDTSANSWIQIYTEILVGILSKGCERNETMGQRLYYFHTNVTTFLPWIQRFSDARFNTFPFPQPFH